MNEPSGIVSCGRARAPIDRLIKAPNSDAARQWEGWGTALKPALECIALARKSLIGTIAETVLKHGTGAINVDACRIETAEDRRRNAAGGDNGLSGSGTFKIRERCAEDQPDTIGRWPANVVHDGSAEVVEAFPESDGQQADVRGDEPSECHSGVYSGPRGRQAFGSRNDSGSASRFFYTAKADTLDRLGSKHPTVKPVDLMRWLVRLVTPPGGTVLDPFAGTGTTGLAAMGEGFDCILCEREPEYLADIERRLAWARGQGPTTDQLTAGKQQEHHDLPLFGHVA